MNSTSPIAVSVNESNNAPSPQTQNPFDSKIYSSAVNSVVQILQVSIGVVGITGNLLALIVFLGHKPLLKRPANYFIVSQCTLNLLVSIMLILMTPNRVETMVPTMISPLLIVRRSLIGCTISRYRSTVSRAML